MPLYRARAKYRANSYTGSSTVANTSAETVFALTHFIPAYSMKVGKTYRVTARGVYGTKATASGAMTVSVKLGSTTIGSDSGPGTTAALTNRGWLVQFDFTVTAVGASGAGEGQGFSTKAISAINSGVYDMEKTTTTTVNTTIDQTLGLAVTWFTSDPDNAITIRQLEVEELG